MENFKMIKNAAAIIVFFCKKLITLFSTFYDFKKCLITMVYRARYNKIFDKSKFCPKSGFFVFAYSYLQFVTLLIIKQLWAFW